MRRDLIKAAREHSRKYGGGSEGAFNLGDVIQIKEASVYNGRVDVFQAIGTALQAGFMVGYRKAQRDARRRTRRRSEA